MDMVARSRSLPPGNPFWSRRAQGELELRMVRPVDLPVPLDPEMDGEDMVREGRGRASSRDGQRSRELVVDREEEEEAIEKRIFRTPASWTSQREPLGEGLVMGPRTSGLMPPEEMAMEQGVKPTEGPFRGRELVQDQIERDLEREVVKSLHEENLRLKRCLQAMEERQNTSGSGWSEVTAETPRPPPPPPTVRGKEEDWELVRWTPNGTRVPDGPPPRSQEVAALLPEWPFEWYERAECDVAMKWLGPSSSPVRATLHPGVCDGGMESRMGHEECGGGVNPRLSRGEVEGGMESRRSGAETAPMTAVEARTAWLERELIAMKRVMEREASLQQRLRTEYWRQPVQYENRPQGRVHGEVPEGDRAVRRGEHREGVRAKQPELPHQGRAVQPELPHQGRAEQPELHHQGRAEQPELHHQGRAEQPELHHQGRAEQSEVLHQSRAVHHDLPHQGRADVEKGGAPRGDLPGGGENFKEEMNGANLCHGRGQGQGLCAGQGHGHDQERDRAPQYPGNEQSGQGSKMELPALAQETTPMDLGDWLTLITPSMKDMANNASFWWECTLAEATRFYEQWRQSTPLQRVQLKPSLPVELTARQFERTEQRGVGLLVRALPSEMRNVIISNRDMASTAILWRLLITFQPGGNGEKGQLLKVLTTSSMVSTASQLASHLRQWRRCFTRAREIGGSQRVTVRFFEDGTRVVEEGDWRCSPRSDDNKVWRGCTWFKLVASSGATSSSATAAAGGVASSSRATSGVVAALTEESDGSYEMCP